MRLDLKCSCGAELHARSWWDGEGLGNLYDAFTELHAPCKIFMRALPVTPQRNEL